MAVTKTHPIKSTLKAAIDYILNPEKTDGKLLASSFGCGLETADIEFAWTREAAGDRGTHLGRHLIQSFAVGETTPEEAHKIGMELAQAVLGGKGKADKGNAAARHQLFHPQLGVKTLLDGGRRRTKNLYGVVKRTVPAGQVRQ